MAWKAHLKASALLIVRKLAFPGCLATARLLFFSLLFAVSILQFEMDMIDIVKYLKVFIFLSIGSRSQLTVQVNW